MSLLRSTLIVCLAFFFTASIAALPDQVQAQTSGVSIHGRKRVIGCIGPRARAINSLHAVPSVPFGSMYYALPMFVGPHGLSATSDYPSTITAYDSQYRKQATSNLRPERVINPSFYDSGSNPDRKLEFPIIHTLDGAKDFQLDAERAFRAGQYRDSVSLVEHAMRMDPLNGLLKLFSSQANFASARYRIAATELDEATRQLGPDEWDFFGDHFRAFYGRNDYVRQTKALAQYVERRPDDYQAKVLLGYHYGIAGHRTSATELFHQALRLNPQDGLAQRLIPTIGDSTLLMTALNSIQAPSPESISGWTQNLTYRSSRKPLKRIYLTSQFASVPSTVNRVETPMTMEEMIVAPAEVFIPQLDGPMVGEVPEEDVQSELKELPEPLEGQ